jgi:hypothetical protein
MPFQPNAIWKRLPLALQRQITDDLSLMLQEVLYEQIRTGESTASPAQGTHLHPTIDPAPGALQSGKPAFAVSTPTTGFGAGMAERGH